MGHRGSRVSVERPFPVNKATPVKKLLIKGWQAGVDKRHTPTILDQMKLPSVPVLALAIAVTLGLTGCASIISGSQQSISVTAKTPESVEVAGATCSFENGKGKWFSPAPGSVTVHRAYGALVVHCEHRDWIGDTEAKSTTKGLAFGNILLGGAIGVGVDIGTGAAYDYPQLISVPMKARGAAAPAGAAGGTEVSLPAIAAVPMAAAVQFMSPQPVLQPPAPVAAAVPAAVPAALPATSVQAPPVIQAVATVAAPTPPSAAAVASTAAVQVSHRLLVGQDSFSAARLARDAACHPQPDAVMTAKGPGFESYSVACINGDALAVRCEMGTCRVLR